MPKIRKEDWPELDRRINEAVFKAVEPLKPQGLKKILVAVRQVGTIAAVLSVFLSLVGITCTSLYQAFSRVDKQARFEAQTVLTIAAINEHLKRVDEAIPTLTLGQAATDPASANSASLVKALVTQARETGVVLPSSVIAENGAKFIGASSKSSTALEAVIALLNYKSYINKTNTAVPTDFKVYLALTHFSITVPPGATHPNLFFSGSASKDQAAEVMKIGEDKDVGAAMGVHYIQILGGTTELDGHQFRNVFFQNVHIIYDGGPLRMTNVVFINCTFDVKSDTNSQNFALAALTPGAATNFFAGV